jgi:hypothetical protein
MLHMLTAAAAAASIPLTTREILSGVWGSISLASWIFLLVRLPAAAWLVAGHWSHALVVQIPDHDTLQSRPHQDPDNSQVPQLIENYKSGSADGISLAFLIVWFIGDITNLAGALWAHLVPTVIALAIYFSFADIVSRAMCTLHKCTINAEINRLPADPHLPMCLLQHEELATRAQGLYS